MRKNKIKISVIGTNGIPARYGGFETLTEYLTKKLGKDFDFTVYCSSIYSKSERVKRYNNSSLIYLPLKANGIQSIFYDSISTVHAFFKSDVLLILGPAFGFILFLNTFFNKKIITNHGGLNEWEREKFSFLQKKYAFLSHKISALNSNINISDNYPLKYKLYQNFNIKAKVIEYGGDHVNIETITSDSKAKYTFLNEPYMLCVARAQSDNNLHILIDTFSKYSQENLVIISNWDVSKYGQNLKLNFSNFSNVYLIDAIYDKYFLNT